MNMRLFQELLKIRGYRVLQAIDGMAGWQMAEDHRPDLILLDIQLPGVTGLDLIGRLKKDKNLQSIPVIAVTAYAMSGDKETCLRSGFDAYISKPISLPEFHQTIDRFLGSGANAAGAPEIAQSRPRSRSA